MRPTWRASASSILFAAVLGAGFPALRSYAQHDDVVVIVHASSRVTSLDASQLDAIFKSSMRTWPGGGAIVAFNLPPNTPLRVRFDRAVLRMGADEVGAFWVNQRVRGGARPPRQVPDAALVARVVAMVRGAIGYVPAAAVRADVRVVARIRGNTVLPGEGT